MRLKLMLFSLLFALPILADDGAKSLNEFDPRTDIISEKYEAGPFLIYDCEDQHYVCVMESFYKECLEKRSIDLHEQKIKVGCAALSETPNKKSCFQKQLFMSSQNHGKRFCIGPEWKQKEIDWN